MRRILSKVASSASSSTAPLRNLHIHFNRITLHNVSNNRLLYSSRRAFGGYVNAAAFDIHKEDPSKEGQQEGEKNAQAEGAAESDEERDDPDMEFSDDEEGDDLSEENMQGLRLDLHEKLPWERVTRINSSEYVDSELLSTGFDLESAPLCKSTWTARKQYSSVERFPPALEEHRKRPFYGVSGGGDEVDKERAMANRTRLENLWGMSNSHGISWDELDAKFMQFAEQGWKREVSWNDNYWYWFRKAEQKARRRAAKKKRLDLEGYPIQVSDGYVKRLTWFYWKAWKRVYLRPFKPGQLGKLMKDFCMKRTMRRESNERKLGLSGVY